MAGGGFWGSGEHERRAGKGWRARIADAWRSGKFAADDEKLANSWVTCACGEQDGRIPRRGTDGAPKDELLFSLGLDFAEAVRKGFTATAARLLDAIEQRAGEVLEEQGRGERGGSDGLY